MKTPVEIDDFVNQMTDMTPLIKPFVGGCGMVWLLVGVVWCGFVLWDLLFCDGCVCGWMMMMGDAVCKYFLAFLVDDKRQRYRSW